MIIPIFIDTQEMADKFSSIGKEEIDTICDNVAKALAASYYLVLIKQAERELHQTRRRYINAISVTDSGKFEGKVTLEYSKDPLIRMIEEGAAPWDMKEALLSGPKAKVGKSGGRYVTVPFRIATPGAVADSDVFSGEPMPKGVYDVVKDSVADIPVSGRGNRSEGLFTHQLPAQYQTPAKRAEITQVPYLFKEYEHKSSIYAGLMKFQDATTGQNTYGTFRRVSESLISPTGKKVGSDPDSWINKGIQQHHLIQQALNEFDTDNEVSTALSNQLSQFL